MDPTAGNERCMVERPPTSSSSLVLVLEKNTQRGKSEPRDALIKLHGPS